MKIKLSGRPFKLTGIMSMTNSSKPSLEPKQEEEDFWGVRTPPPTRAGLVQELTHPSAKQNTPRRMQLQSQSKGTHNLQAYLHSGERTSHPARNRRDQDRTIQMLPTEHNLAFSGNQQNREQWTDKRAKLGWRNINSWRTCKWCGKTHQLDDSLSPNMWSQ